MLDTDNRDAVFQLLQKQAEDGINIILITHEVPFCHVRFCFGPQETMKVSFSSLASMRQTLESTLRAAFVKERMSSRRSLWSTTIPATTPSPFSTRFTTTLLSLDGQPTHQKVATRETTRSLSQAHYWLDAGDIWLEQTEVVFVAKPPFYCRLPFHEFPGSSRWGELNRSEMIFAESQPEIGRQGMP